MWYVEARKYGENRDYFYTSCLTKAESRERHKKLFEEGWAYVHSAKWDEAK